ncbi:hypothetical protein L596_013013 [Steinernema carpocapsae]|uniref:BTB domain-containing protein n=1 Tax=Steinernema carpocapsae TaxID=34508 RepID=A0A4U5NZK5_STECR|nr:hypothetical protein L596_013013 [Steinernema carpocapsae]
MAYFKVGDVEMYLSKKLGYIFKCRLVLRLCEDYRLIMTVDEMDWQKKIVIGDRYKLNSVLLQTMEGVSRKKWRISREKQQLSEYTLALYLKTATKATTPYWNPRREFRSSFQGWRREDVPGFHSHFFYVLFNSAFKEKAEDFYELKHFNPNNFLRFLGIIYLIDLSVDKDSVESLLYLGDYFQCKLVLRLCENYLSKLTEEEMSLEEKLAMAYRYKLNRALLEALHVIPTKPTMAKGFLIGTSCGHEIGDFCWSTHRTPKGARGSSEQRFIDVTCQPKDADKQAIWSCMARVTFLRMGQTTVFCYVSSFRSPCTDFLNPKNELIDIPDNVARAIESKVVPEGFVSGNFFWSAKSTKNWPRTIHVTCQPKNSNKQTILWSCLAKVIFFKAGERGWDVLDQTTAVHLFNSKNPAFHFSTYLSGIKGQRIEIIQSSCTDLSDPENSLIEGPEDAAHFKAGGVEMYLSKKVREVVKEDLKRSFFFYVLGFHSPFFLAIFTEDFNEKTEDFYELKEIKLKGFLRFLEIIHTVNLSIDKDSLESLLYLGDRFQCKLVLQLCEEYLLKLTDERMSLKDKLAFAGRFKLNRVLLEAMHEMSENQ